MGLSAKNLHDMTRPFKTRTEIADMYCISAKTLICRLKKHGIILDKGRISPADYEMITKVLGDPEKRDHKA